MALFPKRVLLWATLGLYGCSGEGSDPMSFIQVEQAEITSGPRILFGASQPDVTFAWRVAYTNPTYVYAMEVLLADAEGNQQPVFRKECNRREENEYGCGNSGTQTCIPDAGGLHCDGQYARIGRQYDLLLFRGCVNDYYSQPVCHVQQLPVELVNVSIEETPETPPDPPAPGEDDGDSGSGSGGDGSSGGGGSDGDGSDSGGSDGGSSGGGGSDGGDSGDGGSDDGGSGDGGSDDGGSDDGGSDDGGSDDGGSDDGGSDDGGIGEDEDPGRDDNHPVLIDPDGWLGLPPQVPAI